MQMKIRDEIIYAKIKEREQAKQEFEQAKKEGKSASLLEEQRPNVFSMSLANIMPGDDVAIELRYTELLVPTDGIYEFVYPTVVGPRYSSDSESSAKEVDKFVKTPYQHQVEFVAYLRAYRCWYADPGSKLPITSNNATVRKPGHRRSDARRSRRISRQSRFHSALSVIRQPDRIGPAALSWKGRKFLSLYGPTAGSRKAGRDPTA